ncbi:hypothetical protein BST96_13890 [Oceanicoccus sagamiensis]|uniref:DUF2062 domain-containing protein n=1 Tax=Oceanicoccus sagamiensis TaxID=716816 RepID=A0A1X9NEF2_9GAMM|nr:hypothetical protein BST96_13890 [Oceanicoccus sagamiensis]
MTLLAKLLKILNSDDSPIQISLAIALAAIMGLTPLNAPHNLLLLIILLIVRVNLPAFLLSLGVFTLFAYAVDPLSESLGYWVLQAPSLQGLWTALYQSSFWRLLGYNNTLILGSLLLSLALSPFIVIIGRLLIIQYREKLLAMVNKSRIALWLKSGKIFNAYQQLQA